MKFILSTLAAFGVSLRLSGRRGAPHRRHQRSTTAAPPGATSVRPARWESRRASRPCSALVLRPCRAISARTRRPRPRCDSGFPTLVKRVTCRLPPVAGPHADWEELTVTGAAAPAIGADLATVSLTRLSARQFAAIVSRRLSSSGSARPLAISGSSRTEHGHGQLRLKGEWLNRAPPVLEISIGKRIRADLVGHRGEADDPRRLWHHRRRLLCRRDHLWEFAPDASRRLRETVCAERS